MTKLHLTPCPACARHLRANEQACPFCGVSLGAFFYAAPAPASAPPARRLSRAALFAFGAGAALGIPISTVDCVGDGYVTLPPYGHGPYDGDAANGDQDGQGQAVSVDAGDSSVEDSGSDAGADGPANDK
jgi:hypothetical protein